MAIQNSTSTLRGCRAVALCAQPVARLAALPDVAGVSIDPAEVHGLPGVVARGWNHDPIRRTECDGDQAEQRPDGRGQPACSAGGRAAEPP